MDINRISRLTVAITCITLAVVVAHLVELDFLSTEAQNLADSLHPLGFGLTAMLLATVFHPRRTPVEAYKISFIATTGLAGLAEFSQIFSGREVDFMDFVEDLVGILGFLSLATLVDIKTRTTLGLRKILILSVVTALGFTYSIARPAEHVTYMLLQKLASPSIAEFERSWESMIFKPLGHSRLSVVPAPTSLLKFGKKAVLIEFSSSRYSGISIDPIPDWSEHHDFSFWASAADGKSHEVVLRIHDDSHNQDWDDRFNMFLTIGPNPTEYRIPVHSLQESVKSREFDLSRIANISFYKVDAEAGDSILIDHLKLQ